MVAKSGTEVGSRTIQTAIGSFLPVPSTLADLPCLHTYLPCLPVCYPYSNKPFVNVTFYLGEKENLFAAGSGSNSELQYDPGTKPDNNKKLIHVVMMARSPFSRRFNNIHSKRHADMKRRRLGEPCPCLLSQKVCIFYAN